MTFPNSDSGSFRIAIVDDDQNTLDFLKDRIDNHYGNRVVVSVISSVDIFYDEVENNSTNVFDVIIMAIVVGEKSGIQVANDYIISHQRTRLIFITAYAELAQDIFRSKPSGLLHKPINEDKLYETIDRTLSMQEEDTNGYLTIETRSQIYNISLLDIRYVESVGHYLMIHSIGGTISVNMKLSEFEEEVARLLADYVFIRCHQSFVVNARHIASFANNSILLRDNIRIPVSRNKQLKAKEMFLDYMGKKL